MKRESVNTWDGGLKRSMIAEAGARPRQSLLGVQRQVLAERVEVEAVATE